MKQDAESHRRRGPVRVRRRRRLRGRQGYPVPAVDSREGHVRQARGQARRRSPTTPGASPPSPPRSTASRSPARSSPSSARSSTSRATSRSASTAASTATAARSACRNGQPIGLLTKDGNALPADGRGARPAPRRPDQLPPGRHRPHGLRHGGHRHPPKSAARRRIFVTGYREEVTV